MNDANLARTLATEAGALLLQLRAEGKQTGKALGKAGDLLSNAYLLEALARHRPGDAVLSEETASTADRLANPRCWIIDPLDGTREYGEGRSDWAVHVGLAIEGRAAVGAVALPDLGLTMDSGRPPSLPQSNRGLRMLVSRTRPAPEALAVATELQAELVPMGSAGAKAMAVLRGEADIYLHSGGQFEWDNCAPAAVAVAAGLHVSRLDGSHMAYNKPCPELPDLLICRHDLAERILSFCR
ncbi:3'(2'),5'-bisphosphate nucleotidase CysQ [Sphingosinicella sp. BN140058]|uniref:3'(2'),5'-bisphosphate nucleotidase CysQ n=1 Tax=Sphingosinicella sp. BN140058 TaxID=1892855 RepID=UPI001011A995|nr:3'(2'),5'-bisphosphate nucleotidase CysQ [Sphingosinicella sp. BN140058]QAY78047.1 3'(2'),5'-bisphosphate nucleotidase CysQ [Sphingosinicella sp. BN140058]